MEKWAVWAASPSRTMFSCDQRSLTTVRKVVHADLLDLSGRQDLGAALDRLPFLQLVESGGPPHLLPHLDDDGGGVGRVRVAVQLHHPVLGLGDLEAEGVEGEVGGEPDVAAVVRGHMGPEHIRVSLPGGAVHAVGGDDEVVRLREPGRVRRLGAEAQLDAEVAAALLQDFEEPLSAQCRETVA
jgi:hypothetical protein